MNYVRKLEGEVGDLAKVLVTKWKGMVSDEEKAEKPKPLVPLFSKLNDPTNASTGSHLNQSIELPIKLEPEDNEPPFHLSDIGHQQQLKKSSSSSSSSSDSSRIKSQHQSSRNGHSGKEDKKSKKSSDSKQPSDTKHHKSHHSRSSHSDNSSSKRKHEEISTEPKETDASLKKPKLEHVEIKKEPSTSSSKSSSSSNNHHHHHHSKSSSKHKESSSSSSSKPKDKPVKIKLEPKVKIELEEVDEEMDGSQGMGFAEALALFDMPSSSKKKDLQLADKIVKVNSKSPSKSSRDQERKSSSEDSKKSLKSLTAPPKLLIQKPKLEPLPDIVNDLPSDVSIPDYRPMPLSSAVKDYINSSVHGTTSMYVRPQKQMSEADLLVESFSSKANRTRVYSGNRVQRAVPSMFEMCIRVLQENIDFLECTGGVPFEILRPVLERAKPDQLSLIEYYNPYLLEESDVLWEPHCKRKFRLRPRLEMESWRELYDRCTREDEEKLSRLTQNIKQHQETTSNGVQKTKLAFVDSMVKPPRNVMRSQEIYGTNRKLVVSAAARTVGLKNIMPNLVAAGDARLRIAAGIRDDAQNGKS